MAGAGERLGLSPTWWTFGPPGESYSTGELSTWVLAGELITPVLLECEVDGLLLLPPLPLTLLLLRVL